MTTVETPFHLPSDLSTPMVDTVIDAVARSYVGTAQGDGGVLLACPEPTVVAITLAGQLFRTGEIDRVVVVADVVNTGFWADEIATCTGLSTQIYYGAHRRARREKADPQVLVSTPDTLRPELAHRVKQPGSRSRGTWELADLGTELIDSHTLWIFDGLDKVDDRGLETYRGFDHFFTRARKTTNQRLVGLRFPGLDRVGSVYDLGRLFCPSRMPSIGEFTAEYCFPLLTEQPRLRPNRRDDFHRLFSGVILT